MEPIVRLEQQDLISHRPTNTPQHNDLQHSHIGARHVHPTLQSSHVHHAPLPPTPKPPRTRPHGGSLCRLTPQPVSTRHERPRQAQSRSAMVHEQRLLVRNTLKQRLLHASACQLRRDLRHGVSQISVMRSLDL